MWVLICTVHLTVCSYHVTYTLQSESTVYSYLNVKELFALSRCEIWRLRDCNWTRTHNHLVHKQALNHLAKLAKWLSCIVSTYLYGAFGCIRVSPLYSCLNVKALLKLQISRLLRARSSLTFRQTMEGCFKTYIYYKRLCTRYSTEEAIDSFFCKALYRKWWKYYMHCFSVLESKIKLKRVL